MIDKLLSIIHYIHALKASDKLVVYVAIITILSFILIIIIGSFIWSKIIDIKHNYFAKSMNFAEDKLYTVYNRSYMLFKTDVLANTGELPEDICMNCKYPDESLEYQLSSAKVLFEKVLVERGRLRVKGRLKENHLIKFSKDRLKEEADLFGERFYNKSMYDLQLMGISKLPIIKDVINRNNVYTIEEAKKMSYLVFKNYVENSKLEKQEILELAVFPIKILKWIKKVL